MPAPSPWSYTRRRPSIKPGIIHACRESRSLALDRKLYEKLILEPGSTASYAWVNFDMDTIDIGGDECYERFIHCANKIRRLKFKANIRQEEWFYFESQNLSHFDNLLECFVVTEHSLYDWAGAKFYRPRCNPEGVFIIEEQTGRMMCLAELDRWREAISHRWSAEDDELDRYAESDSSDM
ncbi:hypothetical protein EsHS_00006379 [Epichloe bromicola]